MIFRFLRAAVRYSNRNVGLTVVLFSGQDRFSGTGVIRPDNLIGISVARISGGWVRISGGAVFVGKYLPGQNQPEFSVRSSGLIISFQVKVLFVFKSLDQGGSFLNIVSVGRSLF